MLLNSVSLKNFMKHEKLLITLEAGMNVIRGSNEAGKSSLLTGIAYNWFGAGALPQPVDDTVTWGAKKSSMKTETEFTIGDESYTCKRSASGAELYRKPSSKPLVTGHKEVSAAVADLFSLPSVASAAKLQIASQNDVRGVISLGATAAAAFIEELIDMREIDDMIKDLAATLVSSSDAKKQAVAGADAAAVLLDELPPIIKTEKLQKKVEQLENKREAGSKVVGDTLQKFIELDVQRKTCVGTIAATKSLLAGVMAKYEDVGNKLLLPIKGVTDEEIEDARSLLEGAQRYADYTTQFLPFKATAPEATWDSDDTSLALYLKGLEEKLTDTKDRAGHLAMSILNASKQIVSDTICPTCGQEIANANAVAKRNAELKEEISDNQKKQKWLDVDRIELQDLIEEAKSIVAFQQKQSLWVATHDFVEESNTSIVPHELTFLGGIPHKPVKHITQGDFNQLCLKRDKQIALEDAYEKNRVQHQTLKDEIAGLEVKLSDLGLEAARLGDATIAAATSNEGAKAALHAITLKAASARAELAEAESRNKSTQDAKARLEEDVAKWRKDAEEIQRNSDLMSALRSARLDISTLLWQKLLGVTETYFSLFRGKESTLNMSKKGILVDGHLSAPSGSTLDVLGLALRLAMSKLFANNGLCVLDEPSAGCDDVRTASMTGGLLSAGFDQVIMVTHKDVDEAAGHLITL